MGKASHKRLNIVRLARRVLVLTLVFSMVFASFMTVAAEETDGAEQQESELARPSTVGKLKVTGPDLTDLDGNPVRLQGVSLHGITWFPDFVDQDLFKQVSQDWNVNLIRIPVYSTEYVDGKQDECLALAHEAIDAAIDADMYVIIDWHILEDHDPNVYKDDAMEFFRNISSTYQGVPNVIYEICNEPNGETTWAMVRSYACQVIPIIRSYNPDSVILVGTPNYCRDLTLAARNPIKMDNIMYSLHFYVSTHKEDLRREFVTACDNGLPVFVSECGLSEASGDGTLDYASAASWFSLLNEDNTSFVVWALCNKDETCSLLKPGFEPGKTITDDDLTKSGQWVVRLFRGEDPRSIPIPSEGELRANRIEWIRNPLSTENMSLLRALRAWPRMALATLIFLIIYDIASMIISRQSRKRNRVYDDIYAEDEDKKQQEGFRQSAGRMIIFISMFFTLMYIGWRIRFSIPFDRGPIAVAGNVILLVVEILGVIESLVLYSNLMGMKKHPLPHIEDEEYPDVDIFVSTYNEPTDLLEKTLNGCVHMKYPDRSKVHVWLCDDNRRPEMRELAEKMKVGYFDRPDNKGAKAGNLNHALSLTSAPYIVTFDADMIPKSDFLLNTIPYFVDAKKRSEASKDNDIRLGLLQTPQCFYTPDVFQHALYCENKAPNEQDFFYRTIEVAKTSSNSVIYGGSNTVLAREALEAVGGFYTESITEDFATGMMIESAGFVSLGLSEPMASGITPYTFKEHIQQRSRWGRGVIGTARQLKLIRRKGLSMGQKLSYLSSVVYWYSPIKNLIYIVSPLMFAAFAIPVFKCGWLDLMLYWFPMYILQDLCLRVFSKNSVSLKWSGIYETSVMPSLLLPVIKQTFGITSTVFKVTDKSGKGKRRNRDIRSMMPFLVLLALSLIGMVRTIYLLTVIRTLGLFILMFWLVRNAYFLVMSLMIIDGRDSDNETVKVKDGETVVMKKHVRDKDDVIYEGITTFLTEHNFKVFLDDDTGLKIGDSVDIDIMGYQGRADVTGVITGRTSPRSGGPSIYTAEITDFKDSYLEYLQILYDRIPTLPQSLTRDYGAVYHLLRNIAHRILR